jgi:Transposase DDE domain group 1
MRTDYSATQFEFEGFAGRQVVGAFDGGEVTSNGGGPLLREADRAIGLTAKVARCFRDHRNAAFVEHRLETLLSQRIHGIVLGHEDLNDHDELRFDPALGLLSDTLRPRREAHPQGQPVVATLAGKSTLNRLEHGLMNGASRYCKISVDDSAMEQVFLDIYVAAHAEPPKQVMLDLDATDDPLHGEQEGRFFHGYYRCYCYLPLYIFDGRHLLVAKLRQANIDASAGAKGEIARIVAYLRKAWPDVEICLRADSGFARDELMSWCEENRVDYVFGLARNKRLEPMIAAELA